MPWIIVLTILITVLCVVVAMNFTTPEKKIDRKVEHRHGVSDPQFRREMSVLLGPSILGGNRVQAFQNGDEIFPAMLAAIRGARRNINMETYIYWSGDIGGEFADALAERARDGVAVHLVVDWVGSLKMDQALLRRMEQAGVRVERYRPLHWYNLGRMNNRTHRKLLVVDGQVGFTGGVGIADQWTGHAQDPDHWREVHFRIDGPVVAQMQAAFNDNWIKTTGELLNGPAYFPELAPSDGTDAHLFVASPAGGSESMHLMYLTAIAAAEHSIDLSAAYFVPDALMVDALLAARGRGVRVRVLVPGPHIDSETVKRTSKASWGRLLQAGVQISEYAPTMIHVKLLVVDGELVSVGSTNFDMRSFRLNDEASLNIYDRGFAAQMTAMFEADLAQARPYDHAAWRRRPLLQKFAEGVLRPIRSQL
ncbi:cardiolipin synthase B [Luteimonas aestuarii]|uniref:Cardiolipin synthase B n=1 Tax=Luteimonas aestuarii TaxID=453837 RepID=A0A4R5TQY3_9GAMM|nr:phospholipase D-like domain-containing protein [Luteimonas aestuarii]TDK21539.1 cardiolipin synthase B [Luteimonas aestuarii]